LIRQEQNIGMVSELEDIANPNSNITPPLVSPLGIASPNSSSIIPLVSLLGIASPNSSSYLLLPSGPADCSLVKSFFARQGIIAIAALIFLSWTAVRVRLGREKRDLKTFIADVSKQGGQQMMGGVMMVLLGLHLSEGGLSPLVWYGAQYPFEIVLTTTFTGFLRKWIERTARDWQLRTRWDWLAPYALVGQYGPNPGDFRCSWCAVSGCASV
jgi:hypothetical protein